MCTKLPWGERGGVGDRRLGALGRGPERDRLRGGGQPAQGGISAGGRKKEEAQIQGAPLATRRQRDPDPDRERERDPDPDPGPDRECERERDLHPDRKRGRDASSDRVELRRCRERPEPRRSPIAR